MSAAIAQAAEIERRSPPDAGGVPGRYKICENCARNFFRCLESKRGTCCSCTDALRPGSMNQLWNCSECGMFRAWGSGAPEETVGKILRCSHCREMTRHSFWKVA